MKKKIKEAKRLRRIKRDEINIKKRKEEKQAWLLQKAAQQKGTTIRKS